MTLKALYEVAAPAKINLFLHVVGRRADGYHLLQSAFVLIDWADTLHFELRHDGLVVRHDRTVALPANDLCLRAAQALKLASGTFWGADISIEKQVPSGAGLGGGSSDAATTLIALNRLWGLNWPRARLMPLALRLGADVPFFVGGQNAWVEGIGEQLTPIAVPRLHLAVIKPPVDIPTRELFGSPLLVRDSSAVILSGFLAGLAAESEGQSGSSAALGRNDLQAAAEDRCPEVAQAARWLEARFGSSRMTGSGSAVFARVADKDGMGDPPRATLPVDELPPGWVGRMCRSLDNHPLYEWLSN